MSDNLRESVMLDPEDKVAVRNYWEAEACGESYGDDQEQIRYGLEPEILSFADFASAKGHRVLEIGVGMGADYVRWLRAGAQAEGVDLTERAIQLTAKRAAEEGLVSDLRVADAEELPFEDESFDLVYSWGVLHHTPDTKSALAEACRVLRPGGRLKVMLYHRHSWAAVAAWLRFCLLAGHPMRGIAAGVEHLESPGTKAFTVKEVRRMLPATMERVDVRPILTHWDRRIPWPRWLNGIIKVAGTAAGDRLGWFLLVVADKRAGADVTNWPVGP